MREHAVEGFVGGLAGREEERSGFEKTLFIDLGFLFDGFLHGLETRGSEDIDLSAHGVLGLLSLIVADRDHVEPDVRFPAGVTNEIRLALTGHVEAPLSFGHLHFFDDVLIIRDPLFARVHCGLLSLPRWGVGARR